MPGKKPFYKSKPFVLAVGIAISVVCLWLAILPLLETEDAWGQFVNAFKSADYRSLPLIWLTLIVFYWLKAWRWRLMLSPVGNYRPTKDLLPPIMIGFSFNNILPARIGEVARCFVFSKQQKQPFSVAVSSVVLERFFDLIAILFYLGIGLVFVKGLPPAVQQKAMIPAIIAVVGMLGGLAFVIWTKPVLGLFEKIMKSIPLIPHSLTDKICGILETGAQGLGSLKNGRLLAAMLAISIIKWGLNSFLVMLSLWSFDLPATPMIAFVVMGVVAFGVAVPAAPGFFGVMQLCFMLVLQLFVKADDGEAAIIAASIYYQMTQYIPVTLIGLFYFFKSGLSLHDVEEKQEADEAAAADTLPDAST